MLWSQCLARNLTQRSQETSQMRGVALVGWVQGGRRRYDKAISRWGWTTLAGVR